MLELKKISAGYGKKQVLFDVSFGLAQGEIGLLIGGNGAGKSTVLKTIYGQLKPWNDGRVFFDGAEITGQKSSKMLKKGLVYIPQKDNCFEELTVLENLELSGLSIKDKKDLQKRIEFVFDIIPLLSGFRKKTPFKMSGGERQLLALGMALLHHPTMILFDEPTAGLSPKNTELVIKYISGLNEQGTTFLIVEHKVKETLALASKLICMKYGKIFKIIESNKYGNTNNSEIEYIGLLDDVFV